MDGCTGVKGTPLRCPIFDMCEDAKEVITGVPMAVGADGIQHYCIEFRLEKLRHFLTCTENEAREMSKDFEKYKIVRETIGSGTAATQSSTLQQLKRLIDMTQKTLVFQLPYHALLMPTAATKEMMDEGYYEAMSKIAQQCALKNVILEHTTRPLAGIQLLMQVAKPLATVVANNCADAVLQRAHKPLKESTSSAANNESCVGSPIKLVVEGLKATNMRNKNIYGERYPDIQNLLNFDKSNAEKVTTRSEF